VDERGARAGVVGLSRGLDLARAWEAVGGKVHAVLDLNSEKARSVAAQYGAKAFDDYEALLDSDVDAVIIASPSAFHADQAIRALDRGKHVLSEVIACHSTREATALVRAARQSDASYMLAENFLYLDEVELVKRLHHEGRFGAVYYAEGDYLQDCRDLWYEEDGGLSWRGRGGLGVYCTHSLGPLLHVLDDRVARVSALAVPGGQFDPQVTFPTMHLMDLTTAKGVTLRLRIDHVSPRPHQWCYFALQGTRGSYEAWRGFGDESKIWFEGEHQPASSGSAGEWGALSDYAERYVPDLLADPIGPDLRMMRQFLSVVREEGAPQIDVFRAMDFTLPGILSAESAAADGVPQDVPDPRRW